MAHAHRFKGILSSYDEEGPRHTHTVMVRGRSLRSANPEPAPEGGHQHRLEDGDDIITSGPDIEQKSKAVWSTAFVNRLPDSSFLYIAPGGKKDDDGKTVPRSLRYFPVRNENGALDIPHLRNAIARIPQSTADGLTEDKKDALQERARRFLAEAQKTKKLASSPQEFPHFLTGPAVEKGDMPELGDSGIPWSLEDVVPHEYRYWESGSDDVAKAIRDELVGSGWFDPDDTVVVDGVLQKIVNKTFLFTITEEEKTLTPVQRKELAEENDTIQENRLKILSRQEHEFQRAKFTSGSRPRCLICGNDEPDESTCNPGSEKALKHAECKVINLFKTEKSTDDERFVLGLVLEPNDGEDAPLNPDTQQDIYSAEEIKQACHLFMEKFQNIGDMHTSLANSRVKLVECYISPVTFKITDPFGEEQTIFQGTWLMGLHVVDDEMWEKVKSDELTGLSIGGSAQRVPTVMSLADVADQDDDSDDSDDSSEAA